MPKGVRCLGFAPERIEMSGLERSRTRCDGNHRVACDGDHATKSRRWRNFAAIGAGFRHSCLAGETILGLGESISLRMKGRSA